MFMQKNRYKVINYGSIITYFFQNKTTQTSTILGGLLQ